MPSISARSKGTKWNDPGFARSASSHRRRELTGFFTRNCDDAVSRRRQLTSDTQTQPPASTGHDDITHGRASVCLLSATAKARNEVDRQPEPYGEGSASRQSCRISCSSSRHRSFRRLRARLQNHVGDDERTRDRVLSRPDQRHPNLRVTIDNCFDFLRMYFQAADVDDPISPARRSNSDLHAIRACRRVSTKPSAPLRGSAWWPK